MLRFYQQKRRQRREHQHNVQKSLIYESWCRNYALHSSESGLGNRCKHHIVVSLTSFEKRIDNLYITIESLFQQSLKADCVVLWLSRENFPGEINDIPEILRLQEQRGLTIRFVEGDLGPYKKIIYSLREFPDSVVVTVDDDIIYPIDTLDKLYRSYLRDPSVIHCNRAYKVKFHPRGEVLPYEKWNVLTGCSTRGFDIFPTGNAGVLYFPGALHHHVQDETRFMLLCRNADDIWLKAMSLLNRVPCQYVGDYRNWQSRFLAITGGNASTLHTENKRKVGGNDKKLKAVFDFYDLWGRLRETA